MLIMSEERQIAFLGALGNQHEGTSLGLNLRDPPTQD